MARGNAEPRRPIRLLIIDDDADIVEILCLRFRRETDFIVESAHSGLEGLMKARKFHPDVVLLDVVMPHIDGWEVCRKLRSDPSTADARVIAMTAQAGAAAPEVVQACGAHGVLSKPMDLDTITAAIVAAAA